MAILTVTFDYDEKQHPGGVPIAIRAVHENGTAIPFGWIQRWALSLLPINFAVSLTECLQMSGVHPRSPIMLFIRLFGEMVASAKHPNCGC